MTAAGDLLAGLQEVHAREFPHRPPGMMRLSDDTLVACLYLLDQIERLRQELLARPRLRQADIDRILRTSLHDPE